RGACWASSLEQDESAVVGRGSAAGEGGDVGEDGLEDLPRRLTAQVLHVTEHALFAEALAGLVTGIDEPVGEQRENRLAAAPGLVVLLTAHAESQRRPCGLEPLRVARGAVH